jgi:hypothetical protein
VDTYQPRATGSATSGKPSGATNYTCEVSEECGYWFCNCEDGGLVNAGFCENGYCMDDYVACPQACSEFGHGAWVSTAGGGPGGSDEGSSSSSSSSSGSDAGTSSSTSSGICDELGTDSCSLCIGADCCPEIEACDASTDCNDFLNCITECAGDTYCESDCGSYYPTGAYLFNDLLDCRDSYCSYECS